MTLAETLLEKYEIHFRLHQCGGKSCDIRSVLWHKYMKVIRRETIR